MKIGVFDSGLGGLLITHSLVQALPQYDYLYLGDTARLPYGNRSGDAVYEFTRQGVDYLFGQGCGIIVVACNTASSEALSRIQQEYLPEHYPDRRVLGVIFPAAEAADQATRSGRIGVLATRGTTDSKAFSRELLKLSPLHHVVEQAAPLLVPLIENNGGKWAAPILAEYLKPLANSDTIILGCTHFPFLKSEIRQQLANDIVLISQDEVVPAKLADYLRRHIEIESTLTRESGRTFQVTDLTSGSLDLAKKLFGDKIDLQQIERLDHIA